MEEVKVNPDTGVIDDRDLAKENITQEVDARKFEAEIKNGYREVTVEGYGKLHIHKPTVEDDYEADLAYAKEVSKLMNSEELQTIEEMEEKLAKRGTWTDEHKERLEALKKEMIDVNSDLYVAKMEYKKAKSPKLKAKIKKLTDKYESLKKDFFKLEAVKNRFMSLTIEGRADEKRLVTKMSRCVRYPDGKLVWSKPEDLAKEKDAEPVGQLVFEFITFTQGIDPQVLEQLPDILNNVGELD